MHNESSLVDILAVELTLMPPKLPIRCNEVPSLTDLTHSTKEITTCDGVLSRPTTERRFLKSQYWVGILDWTATSHYAAIRGIIHARPILVRAATRLTDF
jgi:hypothetical protein